MCPPPDFFNIWSCCSLPRNLWSLICWLGKVLWDLTGRNFYRQSMKILLQFVSFCFMGGMTPLLKRSMKWPTGMWNDNNLIFPITQLPVLIPLFSVSWHLTGRSLKHWATFWLGEKLSAYLPIFQNQDDVYFLLIVVLDTFNFFSSGLNSFSSSIVSLCDCLSRNVTLDLCWICPQFYKVFVISIHSAVIHFSLMLHIMQKILLKLSGRVLYLPPWNFTLLLWPVIASFSFGLDLMY